MRIFQKPKPTGKIEVTESIFRDPKELEALKAKVKPELYLKGLYDKIFLKEKELESITTACQVSKQSLEEELRILSAEGKKQIDEIENILFFKREERAELEKPLTDKSLRLDEREIKLDMRSESLDIATQAIFERERATENKLEGIQDLADTLGETRVRLVVKEKTLQSRENLLKDHESNHLIQVGVLDENIRKANEEITQRECDVSLRELNVQSENENMKRREKELLDGYIRLEDQRGVLSRAWAELENKRKQYGNSTKRIS